ncbi:Set1 complex component ash2 [Truncatella angustata]|uniref:Set1 complex component ash2 n=1 Tax=Truncatella angustata TaxID=152316 RepID=A0A9P8UWE3_9PEZI|nr:Set1 complex component ash2 [Truncatella angustata]KAH6659638.1 Set1 complex component ash2 [Truncatella angustata]
MNPPAGSNPNSATSLPQKRALEDDHVPAVSSPLNPNPEPKLAKTQSHDDIPAMAREKRAKKESLKKRESKGVTIAEPGSSRATPEPRGRSSKEAPPNESSPLRYKLAPPKPSDFEPARGPVFTHHHNVPAPDGSAIEFHEISEHVYNKKNFHYLHCIADPAFPSSFYYRQTEPEPCGAHISFEDAATHMFLDQSGRHITTDKGYRMARANVAVRQGRWYWECKITRGTLKRAEGAKVESHGHVRLGFARREASLDAPVGFDAYSYGIRDVEGEKVHMSRPKAFFPPGEDIAEGDVIGLEIQLPSEQLHRKVVQGQYNPAVDLTDDDGPTAEGPNIVRDRIPIRFKAHIYFEKIDYHSTKELEDLMNPSPVGASGSANNSSDTPNPLHPVPALRTLPNSSIKIYKNGVLMGTPFTNLLAFLPPASKPQAQVGARDGLDDGMLGYYPAISVFRGGAAEVNFGPDFWYPPPGYSPSSGPNNEDVEMTDDSGKVADNGPASRDKLQPIEDRYTEQIVEDIVADIVDEVDFWMQDGAKVIDRTGGRDEKADVSVDIAPGREEIKELVQDD